MTTDSNHKLPVAPNVLDRKFTAEEPDKIWLTDITYVPTAEGWLYLAAVMDLYSRRIVGWAMSDSLHRQLVIDALQMAIAVRHRDYCTTRIGAASMPAKIIKLC